MPSDITTDITVDISTLEKEFQHRAKVSDEILLLMRLAGISFRYWIPHYFVYAFDIQTSEQKYFMIHLDCDDGDEAWRALLTNIVDARLVGLMEIVRVTTDTLRSDTKNQVIQVIGETEDDCPF